MSLDELPPYKNAYASLNASGNIVDGVEHRVIKIHGIFAQATGNVEGNFRDQVAGKIIGHFKFNDREGFVMPNADYPAKWFTSAPSQAFYCEFTTVAQTYWMVIYTDADSNEFYHTG